MSIIFNSASTDASERFNVRESTLPTSVFAGNFGVGDEAVLQFSQDEGATWIDAYIGGDKQTMSSTGNVLYVNQPGVWRMNVTNSSGATLKLTTEIPARR